MAKKKYESDSGCAWILLIVIAIVLFFTTTISNIFNLSIIPKYGIKQFCYNVIHLHANYDCIARQGMKVYEEITPVDNLDKEKYVSLNGGQFFGFRGYQSKDYVTWIAVELYHKNNLITGYAYIPDEMSINTLFAAISSLLRNAEPLSNAYFRELSSEELTHIKDIIKARSSNLIIERVHIEKAQGREEKQRIKESSQYKLITYNYLSPDTDSALYCKSNDYGLVENIHNMYMGKNFKTNLYQTANYVPEIDGIYEEPFYLSLLDNIYFKIILAIIVIVSYLRRKKEAIE